MACALLLTAAACGNDKEAGAGELTYYRDIKPIVDAKCAGCHFEGGAPPMPLGTYEEVAAHAGTIELAVGAGIMPPWHPSAECNDYVAVRALDDAHKAAILAWVDAGAPAGDPAREGPPLEIERTTLSRVDATLTMPEAYLPATAPGSFDDYRCFIVPWTEATTKYVTGFRARPGNLAVAHHAIAFLAPPSQAATYMALDAADAGPGWTCFGGPGGPGVPDWIGGWAPGNDGSELAPGLGIEIQPGSLIVLQMHYHTSKAVGSILTDRTSLELRLADQVDQRARILPWANPGWVMGTMPMLIPANEPDVVHAFGFDPTIAPLAGANRVSIYNAGLHLHRLGTRARLSIERAGGGSACLLQIDAWDFDWQGDYALREPQVLTPGDQLRVECHWDNTVANQPTAGGQPQPPRDVTWGEASTDEMCLGIFLVAVE
jgi:hypothetical protein